MAQQFTHLYNTAEAWVTINPILFMGEMGFESDNKGFKVGDGVTPWNQLPYSKASAQIFTSGVGITVEDQIITAQLQYEVVDSES